MKKIIAFWKKDLISKAILIVAGVAIIGLAVNVYLVITLTPEGVYRAIVPPTPRRQPTALYTTTPHKLWSSTSTSRPPFPTNIPVTSAPTLPAPTLASPVIPTPIATLLSSATANPSLPTPLSSGTVTPALPTPNEFAACIPAGQTPEIGTALETLDGNTVRILFKSDGLVYVVRYIGIEVPPYENGLNLWGRIAFQKNNKLVYAKTVMMFKDGPNKDANGRFLRYVLTDNAFINHELIRLGLATASTSTPPLACESFFQSAEAQARAEGVGRWVGVPTAKP